MLDAAAAAAAADDDVPTKREQSSCPLLHLLLRRHNATAADIQEGGREDGTGFVRKKYEIRIAGRGNIRMVIIRILYNQYTKPR